MKAKTKRRIKHLVTKKKLVKKKTSRHILRSFVVILATISTGSLAYAITLNKPVVTVDVHSGSSGKAILAASTPTPTPAPGANGPVDSGRASWYALGLPAPDAITCASRTYPRGSYLKVTDLRNGRTVNCLVNDYGPEAWTGRIIDLSRGSFNQVDSLGTGTISVTVQRVSGPTSMNLPLLSNFSDIVGYSLCQGAHTSQFCDLHRQE